MPFVWLCLFDATARPDVTAIGPPRPARAAPYDPFWITNFFWPNEPWFLGFPAPGRSGWFAGAEAAEHAGVLEADGVGGGLDGGAVADQVLGSLQP